MGGDWEEETKIAPKDGQGQPPAADRDRAYLIVLAGTAVGEMYKLSALRTIIGRGQNADIQVLDDGISRRHAEIVHDGRQILIRDLQSTNGTYCNGNRIEQHVLCDGDKIQVGSTTILKFTFHDSLDESFQRQMYESALRDGLTQLYNKKYFADRLDSEFAYAQRHRSPLSLVLFDIDHFKRINDTHGHLAGDYALAELARVVSETVRQEDIFARYGGEEFAVICRGTDLPGAKTFGERIRRRVESQPFVYDGNRLQITVSVGVAELPKSGMNDPNELVGAADDALYQAKKQGRNRVVFAGQSG